MIFWFGKNNQKTATAKNYNIVITGYGGQGVITLANFISELALEKGFEVKQAEIHGLAQRGGSVQTQIRFGKNIFSPKVKRGEADLVIALDFLEAARSGFWASQSKTTILADSEIFWPYESAIKSDEVEKEVRKVAKKLETVDATKTAQKITGNPAAANVFMLAKAIKLNLLPFEKEKAWLVIEKNLPKEYIESNKKVFEIALK